MQNQMANILLNTDSYKVSMWKQYPEGTEYVYSYIEARGGPTDKLVWFGLQAFIEEYLTTPITQRDIDFADDFWTAHGEPFNREGWQYILDKHDGYLPIVIKQAPEGSVIPVKNVLAVIENTDPAVPWITTWVETAALRAAWAGTNVASISWHIKQLIKEYLEKSGDVATLPFKLHDFGARGAASLESAGIGGAAHLINFMGTDNVSGILHASRYYYANPFATGFSIPAAEHSTITSWGRENEREAYGNQFKQFGKKDGLFSVVSDSYSILDAVVMWCEMAEEIKASGATLVIRPDSGDPLMVLPAIIARLERGFGYTINDKGYRLLNNVRLMWGDGIDYVSISGILRKIVDQMGYSADNIAFGMGGALQQKHDRDTYQFAMKCSAIRVNGEWRDVFKDPVTDPGKTSKKGRVTLFRALNGEYYTGREDWPESALVEVFRDGDTVKVYDFQEVQQNSLSF